MAVLHHCRQRCKQNFAGHQNTTENATGVITIILNGYIRPAECPGAISGALQCGIDTFELDATACQCGIHPQNSFVAQCMDNGTHMQGALEALRTLQIAPQTVPSRNRTRKTYFAIPDYVARGSPSGSGSILTILGMLGAASTIMSPAIRLEI